MARLVSFEGKRYSFPDDATDDEIAQALTEYTAPPPTLDVLRAIPGGAKRQIMGSLAGLDIALGDVTGGLIGDVERGLAARRGIAQEEEQEVPKNLNLLQKGLYTGGSSGIALLPTMVATAPFGLLRGAPLAFRLATSVMGAQTGLEKYGETREAGFAPLRAGFHGAIHGLIEKYTEYMPLTEFFDFGKKAFTSLALRYLAKEVGGEELATIGQFINDRFSTRPFATLGDLAHEMAVTAVAAPVAGALQLGVAAPTAALGRAVLHSPAEVAPATPPPPAPPEAGETPKVEEPAKPVEVPSEPAETTASPAPPEGVKSVEPSAVAPSPPTAPAGEALAPDIPPGDAQVRVYLAGARDNVLEVTTNPSEAERPVRYADIPLKEFTYQQSRVPETIRLEYDGTQRIPLYADAHIIWRDGEQAPREPPAAAVAAPEPTPTPATAAIPEPAPQEAPQFPDRAAKALWNYGRALLAYEQSPKRRNKRRMEKLRDVASVETGIEDLPQLSVLALDYVRGVQQLKLSKDQVAPTIDVAARHSKALQIFNYQRTQSGLKRGEVRLATRAVRTAWAAQATKYVRVWAQRFAPDARILVLGEETEEGTNASTVHIDGVHYLWLPRAPLTYRERLGALYVLAHEFGHILVAEHLYKPKWARQHEALRAEYARYVERARGMTVMEGVLEAGTIADALDLSGPDAPAQVLDFDEWMANQFARYVHTNRELLELPDERKFWQELKETLKAFFQAVVRRFAPNKTYAQWVDDLAKSPREVARSPVGETIYRSTPHQAKPGVDFVRLTKLLGSTLYGDPTTLYDVSIKEMLQNAFDAVKGRPGGKINIHVDSATRSIKVTDNGTGMSPEVLATSFLQIAGTHKTTEEASGGLGMAKGLFIYENERLSVRTVHNGVLSTLDTSGKELQAAASGGEPVHIRVSEAAGQPNGTEITVVIPKTFVDPATNETVQIPFHGPYYYPQVLTESPLFEDVEVTIGDGYKQRPVFIGKRFEYDRYSHFITAKFVWGEARVYVTKQEVPGYNSGNLRILSYGIWQFTEDLKANPLEPFGPNLPRIVYVDVRPTVKAGDPGYPFDLNRQRFTKSIGGDFAELFKYLSLVYRAQKLGEAAANFGRIQYVDENGAVSDLKYLAPEISPSTAAQLYTATLNDDVRVADGKLSVNGREIPMLTKKDLQNAADMLDEFVIAQEKVEPHRVMIHDNMELDEKPLVERIREEVGSRFDLFLHRIGAIFHGIRADILRDRPIGTFLLPRVALGVSFDNYLGVNIARPFSGAFVNPFQGKSEPRAWAVEMWLTMLHEFAHFNWRSHSDRFVGELEALIHWRTTTGALEKDIQALADIFTEFEDAYLAAKELYENAKSSGTSLPGVSRQIRPDGSATDVVEIGPGTGGGGGVFGNTTALQRLPENGSFPRGRPAEIAVDATKDLPEIHRSVTQEPNDQFRYTLQVLDRLPDKPRIAKVTIFDEARRPDVRKQERDLIESVLKEMPGESVDRSLFAARVLGSIIPLKKVDSQTHAHHGILRVGRLPLPKSTKYGSPVWSQPTDKFVEASTHIWEAQGVDYTSSHFRNETKAYWAHTRVFDHEESTPEGGKDRIREIVEVQSDLEQHRYRTLTPDKIKALQEKVQVYDKAMNDLKGLMDSIKRGLNVIEEPSPARQAFLATLLDIKNRTNLDVVNDFIARVETKTSINDVLEALRDVILAIEIYQEDVLAELGPPSGIPEALPKRWWELVLRHEATLAAREGFTTVRMATADTVARVENWNPWFGATIDMVGPGWARLTRFQPYFNRPFTISGPVKQMEALRASPYGKYKGLYDRYADEITKFVKREFGAVEVTDKFGHTWLEWKTDPLLRDLPIVYYNLAKAVEETGNRLAERAGIAELPAAFTRFQGFLQTILGLNQIAKLLPQVEGLQLYRNAMRALHALKARMFEGPNDRIFEWYKVGRKQSRLVEQLLYAEQRGGTHWTELKLVDVDGKQRWVHIPSQEFEKRTEKLSAKGKALFLGIKNDYLSTLQAMEDVVRRSVEKFFADNEVVLKERMRELDEEFKKLREMPYLPDMRFGRWGVQVFAGHSEVIDGREVRKGELVYWEKFESKKERDKALRELHNLYTKHGHKVSGFYDSDITSMYRGLPRSVVKAVAEVLNSQEETRLSPAQMEALKTVEFDQTAAGKFAKYLRTPAKHIGGASKDMRRAYAAYHWKVGNAIAKLAYYHDLVSALNSVKHEAMTIGRIGHAGVSDSYDRLAEYLSKNLTYVMQPQHEFEQLRMFTSLWYLWGSAKTALMNFTSVPVLTYPYLAARFGDLNALAALTRAMKDVVQYWRDPTKLSVDKQRVLEQMRADNVTNQSFASMLASVSEGGVAFERLIPRLKWLGGEEATDVARRTMWQITAMGMMPFRVVEEINRQATGLAAYELHSQRTGKTFSQGDREAYDFAVDAVTYTQNEYTAWARPPLMMGKQSILLLFFTFVQNMTFLMFGGDKSWWRAMFVLAALAGLQGLPMAENLIDVMNWAYRKLTGEYIDFKVEARKVAREFGMNPDLVMHGISHNWLGLGWDTSTSIGAGRVIPATDAIFGIGKFEQRFLYAASDVGGPVGSMLIGFLQALVDDNPNELLRWDRALPPVLRNVEKAWNAYLQDAWVNQRGRPMAENPTAIELVGQSLGFAPTRRTARVEELRAIKDTVMFYTERRANLLEMLYNARRTNDYAVIAEVREKIRAFNVTVPSPSLKITSEDIARSMRQRARLDAETLMLKAPSRRYRDIYQQIDLLY